MFAIVTCPECRNNRMIDLSSGNTSCPYCGKRFDTDRLQIKFKHPDQNVVRDVLFGSKAVPTSKDSDNPMKGLAYKVSHAGDPGMKMSYIADGLSEIYGEFTVDMIDELVPGKGEKYAEAMLEACMIYEVGYGRFRKI